MRDLDFRGVLEDVGDATQQPEFVTVRRRAARMRTRRRLFATGGALAVAAVLAAGGVAVTGGGGSPKIAGSPAVETGPRRVRWAGAADGDHLYALVGCPTCDGKLMASTDGGQTWQERPTQDWLAKPATLELYVLGPQIVMYRPSKGLKDGTTNQSREDAAKITLDGGRTWQALPTSQKPVPTVPAGTWPVACWIECGVYALDPAARVLAPLANQPPLERAHLVDTPSDAGIWMDGLEPATGKPAVAVSRNGGRDWDTHVFAGEQTPVTRPTVNVATTDGRTVYAAIRLVDDQVHLYRSIDGGETWQLLNPDGQSTGAALVTGIGYVTADGAFVTMYTEGDTFVLRVSTDGRTYRPLVAAGGPPKITVPPHAVDDGHYLLYTERAVYLSGDGRAWQQLKLP
jgi:hypothetical protein